MINVKRPNFSVETVYKICIEKMNDTELKSKYESVQDAVFVEAKRYAKAAQDCELHKLDRTVLANGSVTKKEMSDLYTQRLAKKGMRARRYYDAIRSLPYAGLCPFCRIRVISTVDHMLPKESYSALTVTPDNLVASCKDCNFLKSNNWPKIAKDVFIHPYFDIISGRWLFAKVLEGELPALQFYVDAPQNWPDVLGDRVSRQFELLELGKLYSMQAARMVAGQMSNFRNAYNSVGSDGLFELLKQQFESWYEDDPNHWECSFYSALMSSEWFCENAHDLW